MNDLLWGLYLYFSGLIASYLIIISFVKQSRSLSEKIIFSYLLFVSTIILFLLGLNTLPKGITATNASLVTQLYLLLSLIIFTLRNRYSRLRIHAPKFKYILRHKLVAFILILLALDIFSSLWSIYLLPVTEGDTLAYHLQSASNWYQSKSLNVYPTNDFRNMLFPENQNFLVLWNFLFLKNDALIEIIPYFYLLFGVLVVFDFLQKFNKNTSINFVIALLYYYVGSHIVYSKTFSADVGIATLTITVLSMLYSYLKYGSFIYLLFLSIASGLLLGIKTPGFVYITAIYLLAIFYETFICKKKSAIKILVVYLFSISVLLMIGGFQYLRDIQYFHNPFYPKEINIPGLIHLPGVVNDLSKEHGISAARMANTIRIEITGIFHGAFGYQFPLFYIPAAITLFIFYRKRVEKLTLLLISCIITSLALFMLVVAGSSTRYFFIISFLGILCLANLVKEFGPRWKKTVFMLVSLFVILIPSDGKSLARFRELYGLSQRSFTERQLGNFFYDGDDHFFRENIPAGSTILYSLPENALIYPFYGPYYENKLVFANTDNADVAADIIKNGQIDYFMAKSKDSDYNSLFYFWDLNKGEIVYFPEKSIRRLVSTLIDRGILKEIGEGPRIAFYKVQRNNNEN